jgi:uncharacterized membrane protein
MTQTAKPEEKKAEQAFGQQGTIEISGAVPHPQLLSQYNEVMSAGAERIVGLAEGQVRHRQSMESRGQVFTFVLAAITLLGGMVLVAMGRGAQGLVPLVVAVAGLGGLFVYRELRSDQR